MRSQVAIRRSFAQGSQARFIQTTATTYKSPYTAPLSAKLAQVPLHPALPTTALGSELPGDIPALPLHIESLTQRRLNWYSRTMNDDKLSHSEREMLDRAMARVTKKERKPIEFASGEAGPSIERLNFFAAGSEAGGAVMEADDMPGLEAGRIVEVRRSEQSSIGLVLAPVLINGRRRLMLLRSSGEIWPVNANDVQFVMPASLVPKELAASCWSNELIALWSKGEDIGISQSQDEAGIIGADEAQTMTEARRKVAHLLRRIARETERMSSRLSSGSIASGRGGGIEAVFDHFSSKDPEQRSHITSTEVAEYLLNSANPDKDTPHITVRPNTLPAFAAHALLMKRADMFLADDRNMWKTNRFLMRSRAEYERIHRVNKWVEDNDPVFVDFIAKANRAKELLSAGQADQTPEWTDNELDILSILSLGFYETRTTQYLIGNAISASIVKSLGYDLKTPISVAAVMDTMRSIGMIAPADDLRLASLEENTARSMGVNTVAPEVTSWTSSEPTAADAAIDSLRTDSSHRVFVIDDPTAKELDDGIALERVGDNDFWVHVYVADPTRYLARDHPVAVRAMHVGSSLYLPGTSLPLLPKSLGEGELSLGRSKNGQTAMTFSARIDREGNIHDHKVGLKWLKDACVTTYDNVNKALGVAVPETKWPLGRIKGYTQQTTGTHNELTESDVADLAVLRDLADAVRAKRFATAGFEAYVPNSLPTVLGGGDLQPGFFNRAALHRKPSAIPTDLQCALSLPDALGLSSAQRFVGELMVLANRVGAQFCHERNIAVSFRGNAAWKNSSKTAPGYTVEDLLAQRIPNSGDLDHRKILRGQLFTPQSTVSTTALPFWVMGFDKPDHGYIRATSPLRRFDDMLVHWQIKAALAAEAGLAGADPVLDSAAVTSIIDRVEGAQQRVKVTELYSTHYWRAAVIQSRLTGPPSPELEFPDGQVDLSNVKAFVNRNPSPNVGSDILTFEAYVPELGLIASIFTPAARAEDMEVGDEVNVRLDANLTRQLPSPIIAGELV